MAWAFLIGTILSIVLSVDQAAGQAMANNRNSELTKEANKIYNAIAKDKDLNERLLDAYNRRDAALAQQIVLSSPFGTRVRVLKKAYRNNQRSTADVTSQIGNINAKQQEATSQVSENQSKSQTSGSAIADLISGAAKDPTQNLETYKPTSVTEQTIQEVNYGQKK